MDIAPTYPIYNQGYNPQKRSVGWATKYSPLVVENHMTSFSSLEDAGWIDRFHGMDEEISALHV